MDHAAAQKGCWTAAHYIPCILDIVIHKEIFWKPMHGPQDWLTQKAAGLIEADWLLFRTLLLRYTQCSSLGPLPCFQNMCILSMPCDVAKKLLSLQGLRSVLKFVKLGDYFRTVHQPIINTHRHICQHRIQLFESLAF